MAGYSEALKAEEYFGAFNSEDILSAPSSEVPESSVIPPSSAHFLQDEEIVLLDNTIKREPEVVDVEQDQIDIDEFKIEEQQDKGTSSSSFGIKVADFAVDPVLVGWPYQLRYITFPHAARQFEKKYVVHTSSYTTVKVHILTSAPENNNLNIEWKLLTGNTHQPALGLVNMDVINIRNNPVQLTSSVLKIYVRQVSDLSSFRNGLESGENLLVRGDVIQTLVNQFQNSSETKMKMIPSFEFNKKENIFRFETEMDLLGYEGVPIHTNHLPNPSRLSLIMMNMDDYYLPQTKMRVRDMAILMEQDIIALIGDPIANIMARKTQLISKIAEYPALQNYPDILYLIVRQSFNQKVCVKETPVIVEKRVSKKSEVTLGTSQNRPDTTIIRKEQSNSTCVVQCEICFKKVDRKNLPAHSALLHFKVEFGKEIKEKQNQFMIAPGACPYPGCPFAIKTNQTNPGFLEFRQNTMIKHYLSHVNLVDIVNKYKINIGRLRQEAQAGPMSAASTTSCLPNPECKLVSCPQIICKHCKQCFIYKQNGIMSLTSKQGNKCKHCKFSLRNFEVTCRVCDVKIKKPETCPNHMRLTLIEKHLDSDEHSQKQQVFDFFNIYSKIRRFDLEKELKMENLKFFLTALKSSSAHSKIAVMNCISVISSIYTLSIVQYNDLYKHLDKLLNTRLPDFLCLACNFSTTEGIRSLKEHVENEKHKLNVPPGSKEGFLFCSHCDSFIHVANIGAHDGHVLESYAQTNEIAKSKSGKRKHDEDAVFEKPHELVNSDIKDICNNHEEVFEVERAKFEESEENINYFYFCLDCEESSYGHDTNCSHLNHPRTPISINLGDHIKTTNHQNFIPIKDKANIWIKNISYSPKFSKLVIKKWKRLVKDGDITEVKYEKPRICKKCGTVFEDAIDKFKHIKDFHVKDLLS